MGKRNFACGRLRGDWEFYVEVLEYPGGMRRVIAAGCAMRPMKEATNAGPNLVTTLAGGKQLKRTRASWQDFARLDLSHPTYTTSYLLFTKESPSIPYTL